MSAFFQVATSCQKLVRGVAPSLFWQAGRRVSLGVAPGYSEGLMIHAVAWSMTISELRLKSMLVG